MTRAEVVHRANQIHGIVQRGRLTRQGTASANQCCNARTEGGVQSLNEGSVDLSATLCALQQGADLSSGALKHAAFHGYDAFSSVPFDDLSDANAIPWPQTRTSRLTAADGFSKDTADGPNVRLAPIYAEQKRTTQGAGADLPYQSHNQVSVTVRTEDSAEPKAGAHLECHGHPDDTSLLLHPYLVGLNLPLATTVFAIPSITVTLSLPTLEQ